MKSSRLEYKRLGIYSVSDVMSLIHSTVSVSNQIIQIDGYDVRMNSQRYPLFKRDGVRCISCGVIGEYFALEIQWKNEKSSPQFNLYGLNADGNEVMLTKDHIIPKTKGGTNALLNYQVMCCNCNVEKSDREDYTGIIGYRILKIDTIIPLCSYSMWYKKTEHNFEKLIQRVITANENTPNNIKFKLKEMT